MLSATLTGGATLMYAIGQVTPPVQRATWLEAPVLIALITGLVSLVVSCLTAFFSYRARIQESELTDRNAERTARRDYEYEARKRLYQQCEPLLFELYQLSVGAMKRVGSLARTARQGHLVAGSKGWLNIEAYYTLSTVYKLMAPLAIVKIIQRRITLVDLSLDARIKEQFTLASCLYLTFTADFKLADARAARRGGNSAELEYDPNLEFDPECHDILERRTRAPEKYCRQGLSVGRLDTAVEALIVSDEKDSLRCMSFGEFESQYENSLSDLHSMFAEVVGIFLNFHPRTRPILWAILITQLHLYKTIVLNSETNFSWEKSGKDFAKIPLTKRRERYDWRQPKAEARDEEVLVEPFVLAEQYLEKRLRRFYQSNIGSVGL